MTTSLQKLPKSVLWSWVSYEVSFCINIFTTALQKTEQVCTSQRQIDNRAVLAKAIAFAITLEKLGTLENK